MCDSKPDFASDDMQAELGPIKVDQFFYCEEEDRAYLLRLHYPLQDADDLNVEDFVVTVKEAWQYDDAGDSHDVHDWNREDVERKYVTWLGEGEEEARKVRWEQLREKVAAEIVAN